MGQAMDTMAHSIGVGFQEHLEASRNIRVPRLPCGIAAWAMGKGSDCFGKSHCHALASLGHPIT